MSKDSYWFRHDSSSGRGLRLRQIQHIYTHWGKGVYWDVVEILRDQDQYRYEHTDFALSLLCDLVNVSDKIRFLNWFSDCIRIELFIKDEKYFYCPILSENMKTWEVKKTNGSKGGRPLKTETKPKVKPNTKANRNHKIREDNIIYNIGFDLFWDMYDKKRGDKDKLSKKWYGLTDEERELIIKYIPKYKNSQPDKKYRKDPETFLNNKGWLDEILEEKKQVVLPYMSPLN